MRAAKSEGIGTHNLHEGLHNLMRFIHQSPKRQGQGSRETGKLDKERTVNVFLHCSCKLTIYGDAEKIVKCKCTNPTRSIQRVLF